jgi:hypothetical protein
MARLLLSHRVMANHVREQWRPRARQTALLLAALSLASCQNMPGDEGMPKGRVSLALTVPGGITVSSVSWKVLASTSDVLASGTTNTSASGATPSFIVGLPAGLGDRVSMMATTSTGVMCQGTSAPFNVVVGQTAAVSVNINCDSTSAADGGLGGVVVNGVIVAGDNCPALMSWTIAPQAAAANGGAIQGGVVATDADTGEVLSYAWSAGAGSFANAALPSTQYTCGAAGDQILSLSVTDNHTPTPCSIQVTFPAVTCQ